MSGSAIAFNFVKVYNYKDDVNTVFKYVDTMVNGNLR